MRTLVTARSRRIAYSVVGAATLAVSGLAASAGPATAANAHHVAWTRSCAVPTHVGIMACNALRVTNAPETPMGVHPATPSGYGPSDLRSAYALPANGGAGQTIAIVDAYDDPNAASDMATYRAQYGLPACGSGCFTKVSQTGSTTSLPSPDAGWAEETSLDLDMVSAIAPNAHIILVEATSPTMANLGTSVNRGVTMGAKFVSNSYGGGESSSDTSYDNSYFNHPGVAITVSSGDSGYGVEYPAASKYVTAVGGTALNRASNARGWSESVWSTNSSEGAGSGCSSYDAKPSWQHDSGCSRRTVADVSAVADPATGVAVYDTYGVGGWLVFGGTSVAAPLIAGVYADAGTPSSGSYPASFPYAHTGNLNDVTTGQTSTCGTYLCKAQVGYDGPTGLGTPNGLTAFRG